MLLVKFLSLMIDIEI